MIKHCCMDLAAWMPEMVVVVLRLLMVVVVVMALVVGELGVREPGGVRA